jgi:hypothetical protein
MQQCRRWSVDLRCRDGEAITVVKAAVLARRVGYWRFAIEQTAGKGMTMAGTQEPVAVLGVGAMGHGMASSALRAGLLAIVWNRDVLLSPSDLELVGGFAKEVGLVLSSSSLFGALGRVHVRSVSRCITRSR